MIQDNYSSKLLAEAVSQFAKLPGIGERTALRMVLYLMRLGKDEAFVFTGSLNSFFENIKYCSICHNISDTDICPICSEPKRDRTTICVIENIKDLMAIESTRQYNGLYHVLGGIISPMEGIGPNDLKISSLIGRVKKEKTKEVILALSATMEGDTTNYYLYRKLKDFHLKISTIARGVAFGDELEYTNEITLGRSIVNRVPFEYPDAQEEF
jgi:recombination protein RecR